ncbi:MAG: protein translocase subunit SecF, partial [Dehalococcoidia bacterium]
IGLDYAVEFETTSTGSRLMEQITSRAISFPQSAAQNQLLIYLDDQLISQASVTGVISDRGFISGQPTFTAARELSRQLNAGALPIPLTTIQATEVSATLGEDSVLDSVRAGEVGLLAVALFMILFYRLPGVLASLALLVYTALTLMLFKLWPVTLTLSGIAAFVLSVGMAVDANVLIFERMKEELRRGRTLNTAIDLGFKRAWTSIRDSNVATFITCLILYWFGDQFGAALVKGFALTLAIGVAVSMFSAITITRTFLKMLVGTPLARNRWLWNAREARPTAAQATAAEPGRRHALLDFAGRRWWYLSIAAVTLLVALVILAIPPRLVAGIEFTSGSSFTMEFENAVSQDELREAMSDLGHPEARVQGAGENTYLIRTEELEGAPALDAGEVGPVPEGEIDAITQALDERFGGVTRLDFATVSSAVSSEIAFYAFLAVVASAVAILLYIAAAFRKVRQPFLYGGAAVVALVHDALIVLGLFSLLGKINGTEVDTAFITALLTVIGFSVHDTIVVFDRIREHLERDPFLPFEEAVNASLTETLARSLNTSLVVVLTVVAMLLIGGPTIQNFLIVLLVGILAGAYSSIGVAAQVMVAWHNNDIGRFFGRLFGRRRQDEAAAAEMEPAG